MGQSNSASQAYPRKRLDNNILAARSASSDDTRISAQIEKVLADSQPFGESSYILGRVRRHYERRLGLLSEYVHAATALLSALRAAAPENSSRILGDPVVRSAIDAGVCSYKLGGRHFPEDDLDNALNVATHNLTENKTVPPLAERAERLKYLRETDVCPWIWCEERSTDDALGLAFRHRFGRYHKGLNLRTPDAKCQQMLRFGAELLQTIFPRLSRSALDHVQLVVFVEPASAKFTSLTDPRIPGTIFLSRSILGSPWQAAEYLLHESLHVKFVDLEHTHSLLASNFNRSDSPTIRPLWNRPYPGNANRWPINRALTVMHVYTCLALFFRAVGCVHPRLTNRYGKLGDLDPARQERRALDRARYLGEQLERYDTHLGFAGQRFVRWLKHILAVLDPCPPPPDSGVHLLLDLYEREASDLHKVAQRLATGSNMLNEQDRTRWTRSIGEMIRNEAENTEHILHMIGEGLPSSSSFREKWRDLAIAQRDGIPFDEASRMFLSVRNSILEALKSVAPDAYLKRGGSNDNTKTPGEIVQLMVEESGQVLNPLFDALPG